MTLGLAVLHSPWRDDRAAVVRGMRERFPDIAVMPDRFREGAWINGKMAWTEAAKRGTHALVLEDDFEVAHGFEGAVEILTDLLPENVISLWSLRRVILKARQQGKAWVVTPDGISGSSTILPSHWVEEALAWGERWVVPPVPGGSDSRIALWCAATGRDIWTTAPSLVEHMPLPSTMGHSQGRVAAWYEPDARGIDWIAGLDDPVVGPFSPATHRWARLLPEECGLRSAIGARREGSPA